jgi:hypothetical protein
MFAASTFLTWKEGSRLRENPRAQGHQLSRIISSCTLTRACDCSNIRSRVTSLPGATGLTDSQPKNVLDASKIWHTDGTQYGPNRDFLIARHL